MLYFGVQKEAHFAEQNLQKGINLDIFLEPDKPEFLAKIELSARQPLTPEIVADALWHNGKDRTTISLAKNRFSLWAAKHDLDFGIKEVESVIEQRYILYV